MTKEKAAILPDSVKRRLKAIVIADKIRRELKDVKYYHAVFALDDNRVRVEAYESMFTFKELEKLANMLKKYGKIRSFEIIGETWMDDGYKDEEGNCVCECRGNVIVSILLEVK